ncbi:MAG: outer membrane beta-barrel protein [Candidatus Omnitrophota bacterium]|nr:outer membrane beta-barrel protein [Candidatus Omnitrophota bacterium]
MEEAQMKLIKSSFKEKKGKKETKRPIFLKTLPSRAHPYLTESVSYNDNVDSTKKNKKSALVNTFTPGLKMNFRDRTKSLGLDLHINNSLYNNRRRSNRQSATSEAVATFNIRRYTMSISDSYFSNYLAWEEFGVDDNDFNKYWTNTLNVLMGRHFNRIGFDAGYKRANSKYEPNFKESDSTQETINFNQYLKVATKTQALFAYSYNRTKSPHASDPNDSHSNNFDLSLAGVLSPKVTALVEMAYLLTDNKTSADSRVTTLSAKLGHQVSRRSNLALTLSRSITDSATKANYCLGNTFNLTGNHRLAFNPKFNLSFNSGAAYSRYPKKADFTQKSETYTLGLGLSYAFRQWLDFSLDWAHTENRSNVSIDYYTNIFTFKTQAKF